MPQWFVSSWPQVSTALVLVITLLASAHAVLNKRDVRSATGWIGMIWLVPVLGALLYLLLGINRIRREAVVLRKATRRYHLAPGVPPLTPTGLAGRLDSSVGHLVEQARLVEQITSRPLLPGNRVQVLVDGDEAYPAMLGVIDSARHSVSLATYIFDNDGAGRSFIAALQRAHERGVAVRVLVDDTGARYSRPPIDRILRRSGIRVARFNPALWPWSVRYLNLRNHRKLLIADGRVGFTGGMNIRVGHMLTKSPRRPVHDLHFRLDGPVVAQLQEVFAEDWEFTAKESLHGERWFPRLHALGSSIARGIADGPDEDFEKMRWTFLGALASARKSIYVVTPYFLPDRTLSTALNVAALRGVEVDIVLPKKGNIPLVEWAMWGQLAQTLEPECRVWLVPPPFDHSKLLVVDESWVLFGSANWDQRSLRLNFEFNVECYDAALAAHLCKLLRCRIAGARLLTRDVLQRRPMLLRLRDGVARLLMPYL